MKDGEVMIPFEIENGKSVSCRSCGAKMYARDGENRAHHFYHVDNEIEEVCPSNECTVLWVSWFGCDLIPNLNVKEERWVIMDQFGIGDRIRVDIPDELDPDHGRLHGEHGEIIAIIGDSVGEITGDDRDSKIYRVKLDSGQEEDLRWRDLRPPIE